MLTSEYLVSRYPHKIGKSRPRNFNKIRYFHPDIIHKRLDIKFPDTQNMPAEFPLYLTSRYATLCTTCRVVRPEAKQ